MELAGIILAAGKGTRMKSDLPKCLHEAGGLPMVKLVIRAMRKAGIQRIIVVIGHGADQMQKSLEGENCEFAFQTEQLGTGHAVLMTADLMKNHYGQVIVCPGDAPLITEQAIKLLVDEHIKENSKATIATFKLEDPTGYGRIIRNSQNQPIGIVEQKDAGPEQRKINELNSAVYCFKSEDLFRILPNLENSNSQGEYYLTDMIATLHQEGQKLHAVCYEDEMLFAGVNDRWQLAQVHKELNQRILKSHAESGVTIIDIDTTQISIESEIGKDTIILPGTLILGKTKIGEKCEIGPNTMIKDCKIGNEVEILMSHLNRMEMHNKSRCGPFANLRPYSVIGEESKVGNFVEIKNAILHANVSVSHLTYIGDAEIGSGSNIGAGTITCNYDGYSKHRTTIGQNVFVGSNSTLVAPITLQDGSFVAAGSVITDDVSENSLAIGRSKQVEKMEWAKRWRKVNEERQA